MLSFYNALLKYPVIRQLPLFLITFFLSLTVNRATAQFHQVHYDGYNNYSKQINHLDFYKANEGYIAYNNGIGFTTDTGHIIEVRDITNSNVNFGSYDVNITFGFAVSGVKAFSSNNLVVYGNYAQVPAILYSGDGGNTYKLVFHSQPNAVPANSVTDMVFPSGGNTGFAVDKDRVLKTTDGGKTWVINKVLTSSGVTAISATSDNQLIVYGVNSDNASNMYSTTNGGASWQQVKLPAGFVESAYCISATKWYLNLAGVNAYTADTYLTTNSGGTFVKQNLDIAAQTCAKMIFVNDSTGYAIDNFTKHDVLKTTNSGKIWEKLSENITNTTSGLSDIQVLGNQIWAGGTDGFLITSNNSGGPAKPSVYFSIDASAVSSSGKISLINYSHTGYKYSWLRNGKQISTSYNASYVTDVYQPNDDIKLIITNGSAADSAEQQTSFSKGITVYSLSPQEGHKGTLVNIGGNNFIDVTGVTFGGVPAKSFVVNSPGSITAVVGKGASGDVVVTTTKTHGSIKGFVFVPPPKITAFTPLSAHATDTVTITGTAFLNTSSVYFGYEPASYFEVVSATTIKALPANGVSGNIIVATDAGADTIAGFHTIPHLTGITSKTGDFGTQLSLTGTCLNDVTAVTLDGNPVQSFQASNTGIFVIVGEGGGAGVFKVVSPGGSSSIGGFKYYKPPVISSFKPLAALPGASLTISGSGFHTVPDSNLVYFGGSRAVVTAASATSLTVRVPAGVNYSTINVIAHGQYAFSSQYFLPLSNIKGDITKTSFGAATTLHAGNNSHSLAFADFDSNGLLEIIETDYTSGGDAGLVFINNSMPGNIKLTQRAVYDDEHGNNDGATSAGVIDFDQDGKIDLMLAGIYNNKAGALMNEMIDVTDLTDSFYLRTNSHTIRLGNGDSYFNIRNVPQNVTMTDMDGDGKIDFVGSGYYEASFPNEMLADIDGDGKPDVLVKNGSTLSVYRNISVKGKIAYDKNVDFDAGGTIANIATGDFDNDGKLDIAVITQQGLTSGSMQLFRNTSTLGAIALVKSASIAIAELPHTICAGDLNGDGLLDVGVGAGEKLYVYQNKSKSSSISMASPVILNYNAGQVIAIADIDGDKQPDILAISPNGADGVIIRNLIGNSQITSFTPAGGLAGTKIEITGTGFTNVTGVQIGGKDVQSFKVNSATSISAVAGADTTGYITVISGTGTGSSQTQFTFLRKPEIGYVGPLVIPPGESLTMYADPGDATLKFQWFKDGLKLQAANSQYYTAKIGGSYTVAEIFGTDTLMSDPVVVRVVRDLPVNNFTIVTSSVTCKGSNNGSIKITAAENLNYIATLTGSTGTSEYRFTATQTIDNLPGGTYNLCFTIDGETDFTRCVAITIAEPKDLLLYTAVNTQSHSIELQFDGGDVYNIALNGKTYTTTQPTLTLPLAAGTNKITVSTDKPCQGTIEKLVNDASAITPYPNPFTDVLNLNLGDKPVSKATINISNANGGRVLYSQQYVNQYGVVQLNLASLDRGVYLLVLELDGNRTVYKITK